MINSLSVLDMLKVIIDSMDITFWAPVILSLVLRVARLAMRLIQGFEDAQHDRIGDFIAETEAWRDEENLDTHCSYCRSYLVLNAYQCCSKCGAPNE